MNCVSIVSWVCFIVLASGADCAAHANTLKCVGHSQIGRTRVRQHVNPLRREHQQPTGPLDWRDTFTDPSRPLVVDLGCGPGRFLMLLHHRRAALAPTGMHIDTGSQQHDTASNSSSGTHIAAGDEAGQTAQHDGRGAGVALLGGAPVNYLGVEIRKPVRALGLRSGRRLWYCHLLMMQTWDLCAQLLQARMLWL